MGRHSRRGSSAKGDAADMGGRRGARGSAGTEGRPGAPGPGAGQVPLPGQRQAPTGGGTGFDGGSPARGVPPVPDGMPARGVPRLPDGTPARGVPRFPDGTPAHGTPRFPDGTPAHGTPRFPDGTPPSRGGHPEQREAGGGWGELRGRGGAPGAGAVGPGVAIPRQRQAMPGGPRQDYLDAFDEDDDVFTPRPGAGIGAQRTESPTPDSAPTAPEPDADDSAPPAAPSGETKSTKGRAFTGIAAAAVTTVLAVIAAGQVADGRDGADVRSQSATDQARADQDSTSRGHGRTTPSAAPSVAPLTYEQKMDKKYPLRATLKASGKFETVPGVAKAPGKGQKYTYRVDVEQGLGLDGELFAQAVQKTLNDNRSWAHGGARTFERVDSGKPDFVITLASPGTTAQWCAKSGLDTTEDNVSCDSASTERVMINAYRWAQGSKTYGDEIHAYRQMLINHEVGHRLGHGHVSCDRNGELAPVMQQQTKFLDHDGIHCLPNPWPYPKS
ncbi:DUF3152 domain-containing protein [Streptomyces sp. HUAS TT20]|uniref:DUF3152 domain-containing protein n=1 Tax=Streptomyces sp. HUAS TT20 TaxID=3447509 RepID=UPI0021DAE5F2|nr:DUF3152 domain-containing protein [Streptomyces sp. HUAS 15-9]UXY29764.1 DUF3152 domain-containing protein [Streptomyces sp. HUAS 15-9]